MKQKSTDTAFVFYRHGVRVNDQTQVLLFVLIDTAFVLIHRFNWHGVRTPSIYTNGRGFIQATNQPGNQVIQSTHDNQRKGRGGYILKIQSVRHSAPSKFLTQSVEEYKKGDSRYAKS